MAKTRTAQGVEWAQTESKDWAAVLGPYRLEVSRRGRAYGGCVRRQGPLDEIERCYYLTFADGPTFEAVSERCLTQMQHHILVHGDEFANAHCIKAGDLAVGMRVHHKGRFYRVSHIIPKPDPSQGWTVLFHDRDAGLWFTPGRDLIITQEQKADQ